MLAAIVDAEGIEVTDDEVTEALRAAAGPDAGEKQLKRVLKRARSQGADEALREDIAMRKAVDLLVENGQADPGREAAARDKLWTPGQGRRAGLGRDLDARLVAHFAQPLPRNPQVRRAGATVGGMPPRGSRRFVLPRDAFETRLGSWRWSSASTGWSRCAS